MRSKHVFLNHQQQDETILNEPMMFDDGNAFGDDNSASDAAFMMQETSMSAFQDPLQSRKRQIRSEECNSESDREDSEGEQDSSNDKRDDSENNGNGSEDEWDGNDILDTPEMFEDYSAPPLHPTTDNPPVVPNSWNHVVLWILRWQTQFKIPASAIDVLIKFLNNVLGQSQSTGNLDDFPSSLYMARKLLGLENLFVEYVACTACHKLYARDKVVEHKENNLPAVMHCSHEEFPNNPGRPRKCGVPLSEKIELTCGGTILRPRMVFPYSPIIKQLKRLYARPGWEESMRKWVNREVGNGIYSDLYDGSVWRELPANCHCPQAEKFFCQERADSNLGFILNLDWFQPFEGTTHSTGVLYLVVANLPREERYRQENTLIVGILPGPKEASLHQLNHYLAPLVDELERLWAGVNLSTREYEAGRVVRGHSLPVPAICLQHGKSPGMHRCVRAAIYALSSLHAVSAAWRTETTGNLKILPNIVGKQ